MKAKYFIVSLILFFAVAAGISAQSLQNNEYYRKSVEFSKMAETALQEGDYLLSKEYSVKSQENATLSKQYIAERILAYKAYGTLNSARRRLEVANRINFKAADADRYNEALAAFNEAKNLFDAKNYEQSLEYSKKVLELLADMKNEKGEAVSDNVLPEYYVVRLLPGNRDCLWNIAGYNFVYSDPTKWPKLYEENKKTFKYPDNPDLIYPGQVLKIPSINGETRNGFYNIEDKEKYNYKQ